VLYHTDQRICEMSYYEGQNVSFAFTVTEEPFPASGGDASNLYVTPLDGINGPTLPPGFTFQGAFGQIASPDPAQTLAWGVQKTIHFEGGATPDFIKFTVFVFVQSLKENAFGTLTITHTPGTGGGPGPPTD
jgi:hypothetical protein